MALVLCTGIDPTLLATRRMILEAAGHQVVTATNETALLEVCSNYSFDVAVLGQGITSRMKRYISSVVREQCDGVRVLELYQPHTGRALDDADDWLIVPTDIPKELAERVDQLAQRGKRGNQNETSA